MQKYQAKAQPIICEDEERCFFGNYPTLTDVRKMFKKNTPVEWLTLHLLDLSEYCGCKNKLSKEQLRQCSMTIVHTYPYLKISELMLFFQWFKAAKYGEFYGNVDPMRITSALRSFMKDRGERYTQMQQKKDEQERIQRKANCVTWEEYCKMKGTSKPNPLTRLYD